MKHFMIRYSFKVGSREAWHEAIARFIAALEADSALQGRISYRCTRIKNDSDAYYHLAAAADDDAIKALQANPVFKRYTEETKEVSGGSVEVLPLEIIAETRFRA